MNRNKLLFSKEYLIIIKQRFWLSILAVPVAIVIGSMVALFLWLLNLVIHFRFGHNWLLYLLPLAGLLIHFIYQTVGKSSEKGNNLIMEEIRQPGGGIPKKMTPVILATTIITHLFGGSAGREGTAVQMGGSIAAMFGRWFRLSEKDMQLMLTAGMAAGFGAVFGTPVTGAIFAMEVLTIGHIKYTALLPALVAALVGDITVAAWHVSHVHYHIDVTTNNAGDTHSLFNFDPWLLAKVVFASALFGLSSLAFSGLVYRVKNTCLRLFKFRWMIPVLGGIIIIGLTLLLGKPDYLSLGVDAEYPDAVTIPSAFHAGGAGTWSWFWKTIYTSVTLGTGFKGGEVTPLFYIGATLGNTLAAFLNAPVSLFAALGFIAVFSGATNTPLACTLMGVELFGGSHALLFAVACFIAYFFSGHTGIYSAQRDSGELLADIYKPRGYLRQKLRKYGLVK